MHAVVGVWTVALDRRESQERDLRDVIVPSVTAHPGFVAGYWMHDAETGKSHTTIVLDSEESAHNFKALVVGNAQSHARAGMTADYLAVVNVVADARR
ncbi:MAG TPA: hypothetical protein VFY84_07430 [Jiangellales bacterium]|nr:hypothetical protein [Jiangellales bacterium]